MSPGRLGDMLSCLPVLKRVREQMPKDAALHLVVISPLKSLLEKSEGISSVFTYEENPNSALEYEWVLDYSGLLISTEFITKIRYVHLARIHFDKEALRISLDGIAETSTEPFSERLKTIYGNDDLPSFMLEASLNAVVFKEDIASYVFEKNDFPILKLKGNAGNQKRSNSVYLVSGGTSKAKKWPIKNYFELYQKLETEGFSPAFILGGCEAFYLPLIRERGMRFYFNKDLTELAVLFNRAAFVVANDCGIMHLAAVLGTPTIAVFGPTNPACWFYYERYAPNLFKSFQVTGTQHNPWGILKGISSWDMWPSVDSVFNYIKGANFLVSQDKD